MNHKGFKINIIPEETKSNGLRKEIKQKAAGLDPRKGTQISAEASTAIIVDRLKTSRDMGLISNALNKHFIFTSLPGENLSKVISHMKLYSVGPKEIVFEQGSSGSNFFIISSGKLEVLVNGSRVNILGIGDSFGELALLHDSPRSASVHTIEKVSMWGLDRKSFRSAVESVNAQNYRENKTFIDTVPLFSVLTSIQRDSLVASLSTLKFRSNDIIVKEGDPGDLFYIIKDGDVSCSQHGKIIREMGKGSFFGDQALLYNTVRTATVISTSDAKCVAISRNKLNAALGNQLQQIIYQNSEIIAFEKSKFLNHINKKQQLKIIQKLKVKSFKDSIVVIPKGTIRGSKLFIVLFGCLKKNDGQIIAEVFQIIGDNEIQENCQEIFEEDIFSSGETHIAEINKEEFEDCIGADGQFINLNSDAIAALKDIHILKSIPIDKFQLLINCLKIQNFDDKEIIIQQNTSGDSFFMIKTGKVDIVQDGIILRTVTKHDYFGERSILFNDHRTASVIANGPVTCWCLTHDDFLNILGEYARNALIQRIELQDDSITLKDLLIIKVIGKGMFGNVFLVMNNQKKRFYALKTVSRRKIEKYEIQENLLLERKILLTLDHIFILKMIKTFKDSKRLYFLTEFVRGSDLFDVLRELNIVSERDAKFYTSCIILMLEYLHDRDIVYRDLKPENVMIDEEGYPKLIDFGISKILNERTYTIVGTPHYMSPEVITGKGYSFSADYWSLGIMLFEFICCSVPFGDTDEDPYRIYEKILRRKLLYPKLIEVSMLVKSVIEQLLSKNPVLRNGGSVENLKNHNWFSGMNWETLISKQITSPYKPKLPDFEKEIQKAIQNKNQFEELISKEEAGEELYNAAKKKSKNFPANWDQEF